MELEPELLSGIFEGDWEQRRLVPLNQIPPAFIDAILAAEDHRFYEHHGFDLVRTAKAGWIDLTSRACPAGRLNADAAVDEEFFPHSRALVHTQT